MKRIGLQLLLAVGLLSAPAVPVQAQVQVDFPEASFSGYSTGTAIHADAVQVAADGPRIVDGEIAFSGASVASKGFAGTVLNEMEQAVLPAAFLGKKAAGRGTGLETGLGTAIPNDPNANPLIIAGLAQAAAPPVSDLVTKQLGPVLADPVAYASLVRGQAQPVFGDEVCVLGQPISYGLGFAADAQLLNTGAASSDGAFSEPVLAADIGDPVDRTVSQSKSFTYLVPNGDGTFGLASETRQTLAPVTLFKGTANELTIELLGEFVLRATATGKPGGAKLDYAPDGEPTPTTPVVRIVQGSQKTELTFQDVFGPQGFTTPANPVVHIALGEDPRRIASPGVAADPTSKPDVAGDGTVAAGAVDVVRITLLEQVPADAPHALDVRLGHMESDARVPAGGIRCRLPVRKVANPDPVLAGDPFTWTISIPPRPESLLSLACDLIGVSAIDTASAEPGVAFTLESASNGGMVNGKTVTWPNLGNYHPGDPPIVVTIAGRVDPSSSPGLLTDTVDVTAALGNCRGGAVGEQLVGLAKINTAALTGTFTLGAPKANVVAGAAAASPPRAEAAAAPPADQPLPRTGTDDGRRAASALSLLGLGIIGRRIVRRRP